MPQRLHKSGRGNTSVPSGAEFVDNIELIKAQKGSGSNWPKEYFKHKFTKPNKMYKLNGTRYGNPANTGILIYPNLEEIVGKRSRIKFNSGKIYGLKNGNVFIRSSKGNFLIVGPRPLWDIFNYPNK